MSDEWPWDQAPNCAVITEKKIIFEGAPILFVSHDSDDHGWQFLGGGVPRVENAAVVALRSIQEKDPSVMMLAHMPPGYIARRRSIDEPWVIERNPRVDDDLDD